MDAPEQPYRYISQIPRYPLAGYEFHAHACETELVVGVEYAMRDVNVRGIS
jgi:hypothetical protein